MAEKGPDVVPAQGNEGACGLCLEPIVAGDWTCRVAATVWCHAQCADAEGWITVKWGRP